MWPNFLRIIEFLNQKIVTKLSKNGFGIRDPEKNLFRIPDPGVKKAPDPGSGSAVTGQVFPGEVCPAAAAEHKQLKNRYVKW